ncbi:MAG: hypothetical protein IJT09_03345, partial [Abditibacteriota bacterium]|nr:hypothetical protein [Abditibacteriota bacterium]
PQAKFAIDQDFSGSAGKIAASEFTVSLIDLNNFLRKTDEKGNKYAPADIMASPQKFWVEANVSNKVKPGVYSGKISIYYNDAEWDMIPVELTVSKLALVSSSKQCAILTDMGLGDENVTEADYSDFLSAVVESGFKVGTVGANGETAAAAFEEYGKKGLIGPAPINVYAETMDVPDPEVFTAVEAARKQTKVNNVLWLARMCPQGDATVRAMGDQLAMMKSRRLRTAVMLDIDVDLDPILPRIDDIIYSVDTDYAKNLMSGKVKRSSSKWEWLWWDASENIAKNRIYAGIGLWKAGLDGCMPALWGSAAKLSGRSVMTAAVREGVDDTRYLTMFMRYLREVKDLKRAKDADYLESCEAYVNNFLAKDVTAVTYDQLEAFRAKLESMTLDLMSRAK